MIFHECSSMLNAAPVPNALLSYTWPSKCFFLMFFFYILTTFLFYRLFDNVLMKMYSLCGRCGEKKTFKETKICGVIVSKWILFIESFYFAEPKNISYLPFPFYITNYKTIKLLKTFWKLDNKFTIETYWSCWGIDK